VGDGGERFQRAATATRHLRCQGLPLSRWQEVCEHFFLVILSYTGLWNGIRTVFIIFGSGASISWKVLKSDPEVQYAIFSKDKNTKQLLHTKSIGFDLIDYHKYKLISLHWLLLRTGV
jgi:hypothetical protein